MRWARGIGKLLLQFARWVAGERADAQTGQPGGRRASGAEGRKSRGPRERPRQRGRTRNKEDARQVLAPPAYWKSARARARSRSLAPSRPNWPVRRAFSVRQEQQRKRPSERGRAAQPLSWPSRIVRTPHTVRGAAAVAAAASGLSPRQTRNAPPGRLPPRIRPTARVLCSPTGASGSFGKRTGGGINEQANGRAGEFVAPLEAVPTAINNAPPPVGSARSFPVSSAPNGCARLCCAR